MMHTISEKNTERKSSHFIRNFLIGFLSLLIILGTVLGGIAIHRDQKTYMRYSGTICDEATYRYLASYYKLMHMRALAGVEGAEDTEAFWASVDKASGKTQGTLLEEGTRNYISRVLICAALFDRTASNDAQKAAKEAAGKAAEEILSFRAGGDKDTLNALCEPYGFTYSDLDGIALLLYKAAMAQSLYYGASGETVTTRLTECDAYLKENYTAVSLFFIRTQTTYSTTVDENGIRQPDLDEDGNYVLRALLTEEINNRNETMAILDTAIENGTLTSAYFESKMQEHYGYYPEGSSLLHYFSDSSAYTKSFINAGYGDVVATAKELPIGACKKVAYGDGFCYVYKYEVETGAFAEESYENYFTDFYSTVAGHLFSEDVAIFIDDVVIKDRAKEISLISLPYKNIIPVRF